MAKMVFSGIGAVVALALVSANAMVVSAPSGTGAPVYSPPAHAEVTVAKTPPAAKPIGRLVLSFEPAAPRIDRR